MIEKIYTTEAEAKEVCKEINKKAREAYYTNPETTYAEKVCGKFTEYTTKSTTDGYKVTPKTNPTAPKFSKLIEISTATPEAKQTATAAAKKLEQLLTAFTAARLDEKRPSNGTLKKLIVEAITPLTAKPTANGGDVEYLYIFATTAKDRHAKIKGNFTAAIVDIAIEKIIGGGYTMVEKTTHGGKAADKPNSDKPDSSKPTDSSPDSKTA